MRFPLLLTVFGFLWALPASAQNAAPASFHEFHVGGIAISQGRSVRIDSIKVAKDRKSATFNYTFLDTTEKVSVKDADLNESFAAQVPGPLGGLGIGQKVIWNGESRLIQAFYRNGALMYADVGKDKKSPYVASFNALQIQLANGESFLGFTPGGEAIKQGLEIRVVAIYVDGYRKTGTMDLKFAGQQEALKGVVIDSYSAPRVISGTLDGFVVGQKVRYQGADQVIAAFYQNSAAKYADLTPKGGQRLVVETKELLTALPPGAHFQDFVVGGSAIRQGEPVRVDAIYVKSDKKTASIDFTILSQKVTNKNMAIDDYLAAKIGGTADGFTVGQKASFGKGLKPIRAFYKNSAGTYADFGNGQNGSQLIDIKSLKTPAAKGRQFKGLQVGTEGVTGSIFIRIAALYIDKKGEDATADYVELGTGKASDSEVNCDSIKTRLTGPQGGFAIGQGVTWMGGDGLRKIRGFYKGEKAIEADVGEREGVAELADLSRLLKAATAEQEFNGFKVGSVIMQGNQELKITSIYFAPDGKSAIADAVGTASGAPAHGVNLLSDVFQKIDEPQNGYQIGQTVDGGHKIRTFFKNGAQVFADLGTTAGVLALTDIQQLKLPLEGGQDFQGFKAGGSAAENIGVTATGGYTARALRIEKVYVDRQNKNARIDYIDPSSGKAGSAANDGHVWPRLEEKTVKGYSIGQSVSAGAGLREIHGFYAWDGRVRADVTPEDKQASTLELVDLERFAGAPIPNYQGYAAGQQILRGGHLLTIKAVFQDGTADVIDNDTKAANRIALASLKPVRRSGPAALPPPTTPLPKRGKGGIDTINRSSAVYATLDTPAFMTEIARQELTGPEGELLIALENEIARCGLSIPGPKCLDSAFKPRDRDWVAETRDGGATHYLKAFQDAAGSKTFVVLYTFATGSAQPQLVSISVAPNPSAGLDGAWGLLAPETTNVPVLVFQPSPTPARSALDTLKGASDPGTIYSALSAVLGSGDAALAGAALEFVTAHADEIAKKSSPAYQKAFFELTEQSIMSFDKTSSGKILEALMKVR